LKYILDGFLLGILFLIILIGTSYYGSEAIRGVVGTGGGDNIEYISYTESNYIRERYSIDSFWGRLPAWTPTPTPTPKVTPTPEPTPTPVPLYSVRWGDNLSTISRNFGISLCALVEANSLQTSIIHAGQQLIVDVPTVGRECGMIDDPVSAPAPPLNVGFIWPINGGISQGYWQGHAAIDILAPYGATIVSSNGGTVQWAGWSGGCGLGISIIHTDGSKAVYCHLSETWVLAGQAIGQGTGIGAVGLTGWTTGSHLHFELWIGGWPQNPLNYL